MEPHLVVYIVYLQLLQPFSRTLLRCEAPELSVDVSLTRVNRWGIFTLMSTHFIHWYQRQAVYFKGFKCLCLNLNLLSLLNTAHSAVAGGPSPPLAALIKGVFVFQIDGGFQMPVVFCLSTYFSSLSLTNRLRFNPWHLFIWASCQSDAAAENIF